jgi:hypothetical protein
LAVVSLGLAIPPAARHARTGSPSLRALEDVRARLPQSDRPPVLAMHHAVSRVVRLEPYRGPTLAAPPKREWLELVNYWRDGGDAPVWFLAEPERTDLALVDPRARRLVNTYRLPVDLRFFLSGVRPTGVDWYELDRPGWFLAEGWALTPETAGVASADNRGPAFGPITAYVRRRDEPAVIVVGGRHLQPSRAPARFEMSIDGRVIDTWVVGPGHGSFLRTVTLPPGQLRRPLAAPGRGSSGAAYAPVRIRSVAVDGGALVSTSIEQFDVQSADHVVSGFGDGWFELEYDEEAARQWRWMGPTAAMRIHSAGHEVALDARGDAPTSALGGAATVVIRAGDQILGRFVCAGTFDIRLRIPAAALARSQGLVTFESDRSFRPQAVFGTSDARTLSLRIFDLRVDVAPAGRTAQRTRKAAPE